MKKMSDTYFALLISISIIFIYSIIDKKIELPKKSFNVSVTRGELFFLALITIVLLLYKDRINKFIYSIFYDE